MPFSAHVMLRSVARPSLVRSVRIARPSLALLGGRRNFWGGAFESDIDESRAKMRRSRLRSYMNAFDQLPQHPGEQQLEVVERALSAGTEASFASREDLSTVVDAARDALAELQTASLKLELPPIEGATPPGGAAAAAQPEAAVDQQMSLPHRTGGETVQPASDGAASTVTPTSTMAPIKPPSTFDEDEDQPPDVLTAAQQETLVSLRTSHALAALPGLWDTLPGATDRDPSVPVSVVLDVARQLTDASPGAQLRLHLRLARGLPPDAPVGMPTLDELRRAAATTAAAAFPFNRAVLIGSNMLMDAEVERLTGLDSGTYAVPWVLRRRGRTYAKQSAADVVTEEVRRRTLVQRGWHRLRAGGAADATTLEEMGEADVAEAKLFTALTSEVQLQLSLTRALFSYHDRLATRRRRRINALKGTATFVTLNLLDFSITNL